MESTVATLGSRLWHGLCYKHGGNCSVAGCGANAVGLCSRHGAFGICSVAGCGTKREACAESMVPSAPAWYQAVAHP